MVAGCDDSRPQQRHRLVCETKAPQSLGVGRELGRKTGKGKHDLHHLTTAKETKCDSNCYHSTRLA